MTTTAYVHRLPKCDYCNQLAHYDFKTFAGHWAYGCAHHYHLARAYPTLGTGKGQKLIKEHS